MKKEYKDLEIETVDFKADDVITASGDICVEMADACECDDPVECATYAICEYSCEYGSNV